MTTPNNAGRGSQHESHEISNRIPTVDDSAAITAYANFCQVTGTPEELVIGFGLNAQPMASTQAPVKISQRIILNYYTAKRLLGALTMSIQRHEQAFGPVEIDIQKRVQPSARG